MTPHRCHTHEKDHKSHFRVCGEQRYPDPIVGPIGPPGRTGKDGKSIVGPIGLSGESGLSGSSGLSGESGLSGLSGSSGLSGLIGISISGESGLSGIASTISGMSGLIGLSVTGESGLSGIASTVSGALGNSGLSGMSGIASNVSGLSGMKGSGLSGLSGISGISGLCDSKNRTAIILDKKATFSGGGSFSANTWTTRILSPTVYGNLNTITVSSNRITIPAGNYNFNSSSPAYRVGEHKTRLVNITDNSIVAYGTTEYSHTSTSASSQSRSNIITPIICNYPTIFEIQHICKSSQSSNGLGYPGSSGSGNFNGSDEIYTQVQINEQL